MDVTRELPPGEEKPLDAEQFTQLLRLAIERTLDDLRRLEVPQEMERVKCSRDGEIKVVETLVPKYRHEVVWGHFHKICCSEQSLALTDYLWERGTIKYKITGPDPDKTDWANWVYFQIVAAPIWVALERTAREHLFDRGGVEPWAVDPDKLDQAIEDVVSLYGRRSQLFKAYCPLGGVNLPSEGYQPIVPDISLCKWTDREVHIFLERHGLDYLWDDFKAPWIRNNIAEIHLPITWGKKREPREIEERIQNRLDLLKWSLLLTKDQDLPVSEGTCILTCRLDKRGGRFRRDENLSCGNYTLDLVDVKRCQDLVKRFQTAIETLNKPDDLQQALWHFGRACVATLPRDVLLESVMGLEAILVHGGGEISYRFRLHGAVILTDTVTNGEELFKDLKKIYVLRSQAVHGEKVNEVKAYAPKSRKLLAQTISVIVDLILGGNFGTQEKISIAVQKYVCQKAIPNF